MAIAKLSEAERQMLPNTLPEWSLDQERDAIKRNFRFEDFVEAFGFMAKVALLAERADHHPEWSNVYSRVEILLTTHEADGLSARDIALAKAIDRLVD